MFGTNVLRFMRRGKWKYIHKVRPELYDLGADPYMVFKLKAWIMVKEDGAWFGETVQGFFGWAFISFCIICAFRLLTRNSRNTPLSRYDRHHALVPVLIYAGLMASQIATGYPVETRTIAVFAMGLPLLCAIAGWHNWEVLRPGQETDNVR